MVELVLLLLPKPAAENMRLLLGRSLADLLVGLSVAAAAVVAVDAWRVLLFPPVVSPRVRDCAASDWRVA